MATGGDWGIPSQNLIAPPGAPAGSPRIVIGPDQIPPELIAFYANAVTSPIAPNPATVITAFLWEFSTTLYVYDVLLTSATFGYLGLARGQVDTGIVTELQVYDASAGPPPQIRMNREADNVWIWMGEQHLGNATIGGAIAGTYFVDTPGSQFLIDVTGGIEVTSTGTIEVDAGGAINVDGTVNVNSGGQLLVNSGGRIEATSNAQIFVDWFADFLIDPNGVKGSTSQGRGLLGRAWSNSSVSGTTFFPVPWQGPTITYRANRAFKCTIQASFSNTAAGNTALLDLTTGVGTNVVASKRTPGLPLLASAVTLEYTFYFRNNSGSDVSTGTEIRLTSSAGTTTIAGTATNPIVFLVEDIGNASDYLNMPSL